MGKLILIYDTGQTYEIDSDLIYIPIFEAPKDDTNITEENKNENYTQ